MLQQRILTAIPLALFVGWIILFQSSEIFFYFISFIFFIAAYEWANLASIKNTAFKIIFAFFIVGLIYLLKINPQVFDNEVLWLINLMALAWFYISYYLLNTQPKTNNHKISRRKLIIALFVLPASALAMIHLRLLSHGASWLFYLILLVSVADIGAYFSGKKFGKNKLAPKISPGKTKEGLYGAILVTATYAFIASLYFHYNIKNMLILILLSIVTALISVVGDLFISLLKREADMKDSGKILPGHGGLLDRMDSLLAALPVFFVGFTHFLPS